MGVDQPNILFGAARGLMAAVNAFIDKLSSADRIAAVGFGVGGQATSFTADRDLVKQAISRMVGQRQMTMMAEHNIALAEALDVSRSYPGALGALVERECRGAAGPQIELCIAEVQAEAESLAHDAQEDADQTIRGLRELMKS